MGRHGDGGPQQEAKHVCQPHHCLHGASGTNCARARGKEGEGSQQGEAGILGMLAVLSLGLYQREDGGSTKVQVASTFNSQEQGSSCRPAVCTDRDLREVGTCRNCYWQREAKSLQESCKVFQKYRS